MRFWKTRTVPGTPTVGLVVATYRQTACLQSLAASLKAQTYPHFRVLALHDGPEDADGKAAWDAVVGGDDRFAWAATAARANAFGHDLRPDGFRRLADAGCRYLGSTNGDGWYAPVYFEAMLHALVTKAADLAYCDLIHSHKLWAPMRAELRRGAIDVGNWVADAGLVAGTPWVDRGFAGDWTFLRDVLARARRPAVKVEGYFYVHS